MLAGRLNRRVTLERATVSQDAMNEDVLTWSQLATVWASYEPVRDGERFRAGETAAGLSARFVIRWSSQVADLNPKDRLIFEGVTHEIVAVKEHGGRKVGIEISCVGRADG
jgi:SPP1 family predicted phage head-tail adaptor